MWKTVFASAARVSWKLNSDMPITDMTAIGSSRSGRRDTYRSPSMTRADARSSRGSRASRCSSAVRIRTTLTRGATELRAVKRKTGPTSKAAMARPATAGPTIRAELNTAAFSDSALGSSGVPTSSETNACRTGVSTALAVPSSAAKAKTCQSCTRSVRTSTAMPSASTVQKALATKSSTRLSYRSASRPESRVSRSTGVNWQAVTTPSAVAELLESSRTSQSWAMNIIQTPINLISCPDAKRR